MTPPRCYCGHPIGSHQPVDARRAANIFDVAPCNECLCPDFMPARTETVEDTQGRL